MSGTNTRKGRSWAPRAVIHRNMPERQRTALQPRGLAFRLDRAIASSAGETYCAVLVRRIVLPADEQS